MIVYHGTFLEAAKSIESDGILLRKCKQYTDFGKGFYVTENYEYASNTACRKARKSLAKGKKLIPAVVRLEYDTEQGSEIEFAFSTEDVEWLQFIVNNRNGNTYTSKTESNFHNLAFRYEIVSGRVADQNITLVANALKEENRTVSAEDLQKVVYINNPKATQISFHTPNALQCLKYLGYEILREV